MNIKRGFLLVAGWCSLGLACLGVILPLLPTTPFLLLSAACFSRSSPRFHDWLLYRSWFGSYIRHWQQYRALPKGTKPRAIAIIIITFSFSLWMVELIWIRILLVLIMISLLIFMWRMPVINNEQPKVVNNKN